jgi:hypothetical protein
MPPIEEGTYSGDDYQGKTVESNPDATRRGILEELRNTREALERIEAQQLADSERLERIERLLLAKGPASADAPDPAPRGQRSDVGTTLAPTKPQSPGQE